MRKFMAFAVTGGLGFLADFAMLAFLIHSAGSNPFSARVLSILFAMTLTWLVNRRFTFGPSGAAIVMEGARYGGVSLAASLVNYSVYVLTIAAIPGIPPLAALIAGSAVAMAFSWTGYSRFVFRPGATSTDA